MTEVLEIAPGTILSNLVAAGEIAQRAKVTHQAVSQWRTRYPDFPTPVRDLACGRIYWWPHVETWLIETNRLEQQPEGTQ